MKKILIVSQYFDPETFKVNDIAYYLSSKGYEVDVIAGIPNYPKGRYFDGYGLFRKRRETKNGVRIYRTFQTPRGKASGILLSLNYLSFAFFASIVAFFKALFNNYDAVFVHETSPVTQGIPAVLVKRFKRIPLYFWVLDLWPESLEAAGGIHNKHVLGMFTRLVRHIYKHSDKILISSNGFRESILQKGDFADKIIYFPNWGEDVFKSESTAILPPLPSGFRVVFAGNIGSAQDFPAIMQAALENKEQTNIQWIIAGDGREKSWVDDFISKNHLESTVTMLGRLPLESMPALFSQADVLLVALKDEPIFALTLPAKVQAYMASGKPIVAMLNGEGPDVIKNADCGYSVNSGDSHALAVLLRDLTGRKKELAEKGLNGKTFFDKHFSKEHCLENLINILENNG